MPVDQKTKLEDLFNEHRKRYFMGSDDSFVRLDVHQTPVWVYQQVDIARKLVDADWFRQAADSHNDSIGELRHCFVDATGEMHALFLGRDSKTASVSWSALNGSQTIEAVLNDQPELISKIWSTAVDFDQPDCPERSVLAELIWSSAVMESVCAFPYAASPLDLKAYVVAYCATFDQFASNRFQSVAAKFLPLSELRHV